MEQTCDKFSKENTELIATVSDLESKLQIANDKYQGVKIVLEQAEEKIKNTV